ncbi:MAG: hypothetical protein J1F69_00500 [Clostridiales bacterium]|nr:hypothetical protein [Clostridiales bacterium]
MEKRLKRRSILTIMLIAVLACFAAIAAIFARPASADGSDEPEQAQPTDIVYLGDYGENKDHVYYKENFITGWQDVIALAAGYTDATQFVKVVLLKDWEAADTSSGFGSGTGFANGRISIPAGTNIVMDLNGHKVDRNLYRTEMQEVDGALQKVVVKDNALAAGQVFSIKGTLTVEDTSKAGTGKITGGNAKAATASGVPVYGGGVYINGGTFNLNGGSIEGNATSSTYGAGVFVINNGTFNMHGGTVADNVFTSTGNTFGGGICIYMSGAFNMDGGVIKNHKAVIGAGVGIYDNDVGVSSKSLINISGGIITENTAAGAAVSGGGGIGAYGNGEINISDGEICRNRSDNFGGAGIYLYGYTKADVTNGTHTELKFNMTGGSIHHNVAANGGGGGAVAMRNGTATNTDFAVIAEMTGGTMDTNVSLGTAFSLSSAVGGGLYVNTSTTFRLSGTGSIINNRACFVNLGAAPAELFPVCSAEGYEEIIQAFMDGKVDMYQTEYKENGEAHEKYIHDFGGIGGAIYMKGTVEMSGGNIGAVGTPNRAQQGGAIYQGSSSVFNMSGGSIAYNLAQSSCGVRTTQDGKMKLSGTPVIKGNVMYGIRGDVFNNAIPTFWDGSYDGNPSNLAVEDADGRRPTVGTFEDGAEVHVFVQAKLIENGLPFTQNYVENNSKTVKVKGTGETVDVYANPYRFFVSDNTITSAGFTSQHMFVLDDAKNNGDLGIYEQKLKFVVEFSDGETTKATKEFIFGEAYKGMPDYNYMEWTYGDTQYGVGVYPSKITAYTVSDPDSVTGAVTEDKIGEKLIDNNAGIYTYQIQVNTKGSNTSTTSFSVVVQSQDLTDNDGVEIKLADHEDFIYSQGTKHEPAVESVTLAITSADKKTLVQGEDANTEGADYYVTYAFNENAGIEAMVIIHFINDYTGTAYTHFTILPNNESTVKTAVTWQVYDPENTTAEGYEDGWRTLTENDEFTFDRTDQSGNIRAKLTQTGEGSDSKYKQTVYAKDVDVEDSLQNTSMHLVYQLGDYVQDDEGTKSVRFRNAGTYSVHLLGFVNYPMASEDDRTVNGIEMQKMVLDISRDDFKAYYQDTAKSIRLWNLIIGSGDTQIVTSLLDSATYIDPVNGTYNDYNEKITVGDKEGSYARYRGEAMKLELNYDYILASSDKSIQYWLDFADSIEYTPKTGTVGENGKVTNVTTKATITFGDNYYVEGGNVIEVIRPWYIVTITNDLRTKEGSTQFGTKLGSWAFGTRPLIYAFRPEHGNAVIYTYYEVSDGNNKLLRRFALVYSDDTINARLAFYEVDETGMAPDYSKPLNNENYLYVYNFSLKAGTYKMTVTVPENEPYTEEHKHWWENNDETYNDFGVRYYEFTYEFAFSVTMCSIVDTDGTASEALSVEFPEDNFVQYNGKANNFVIPTITLNGKVLEYNVDFVVVSTAVNAGYASLTIRGINSLYGEFVIENAFRIVQADNGWSDIPSIMNWTYKGYDRKVNLITATPFFSEETDGMWFEITTDSIGNNPYPGLERIVLDENGHVSAQVAAILNSLSADIDYYLVGHVAGNDNYKGIDTSPIRFRVFAATNRWEITPSVKSWTEGKFTKFDKHILVAAAFGKAHVRIKGDDGKVYYDSDKNIDRLSEAKAGRYTLTASVDPDLDYSGLDVYTVIFQVFEKPGLPWWAVLLIVIAALGVAALVIFILWKKGVFEILTERIMVAIRTRASVDATIAAVRAAKREDEAKKSVAAAEAKERAEARRAAAEAEKNLPAEERAAAIEAKAKVQAERAEKIRKRAEAMQAQAALVRESAAVKPAEKQTEQAQPDTQAPAEQPAQAQQEVAATEKPTAKKQQNKKNKKGE